MKWIKGKEAYAWLSQYYSLACSFRKRNGTVLPQYKESALQCRGHPGLMKIPHTLEQLNLMHHNFWARVGARELQLLSTWAATTEAREPQSLCSTREATARRSELQNKTVALLLATKKKACAATKMQCRKIKKRKKKKKRNGRKAVLVTYYWTTKYPQI